MYVKLAFQQSCSAIQENSGHHRPQQSYTEHIFHVQGSKLNIIQLRLLPLQSHAAENCLEKMKKERASLCPVLDA